MSRAPRIAVLMWPDSFEDWYGKLGVDRAGYLDGYDGEWLYGFARALGEQGAEVHVVHGTLGAPGTGLQSGSGAHVHFVRAAAAYRGLRRAVWGHRHWERAQALWPAAPVASTLSVALLRALVALRPDAVVVQDYESARFDVAAPALAALGLRVVGLDTGGSAAPSAARHKHWTLRRADTLLAIHGAEARRLRERHRHPDVGVWPAPLRAEVLRARDRRAARERLDLDDGERIVLAAGRLHPVKGLGDLAQACAPLDCTLALTGTGPEEAGLRRRPGVRLLGQLEAGTLADWYAAADVVALASRQEGLPLAVLEALAAGRGVVATAVGGVPDVVRDGETGWLVRPRDVGALRDALSRALADRAEADRRGATGRDRVLARHAPDPAGRELLRLILGDARR
jgi:glycosyltransferase involved in cell wall biosynthesis